MYADSKSDCVVSMDVYVVAYYFHNAASADITVHGVYTREPQAYEAAVGLLRGAVTFALQELHDYTNVSALAYIDCAVARRSPKDAFYSLYEAYRNLIETAPHMDMRMHIQHTHVRT